MCGPEQVHRVPIPDNRGHADQHHGESHSFQAALSKTPLIKGRTLNYSGIPTLIYLNRFPLLLNTPLLIKTHWAQSCRNHPCPLRPILN